MLYLIEILHQTTTASLQITIEDLLYLIEILHQTTTVIAIGWKHFSLYLIEILHQTTTPRIKSASASCCILLKFYIKPQQCRNSKRITAVVSYWNSTSNHNKAGDALCRILVGSYWNSTSNHNSGWSASSPTALYLIEILHQTTTYGIRPREKSRLYLIEILHQTTTVVLLRQPWSRCILLKFYIKPQQITVRCCDCSVVSYWNSTSNHNTCLGASCFALVVSYWNSTSNHNSTWYSTAK